MRKYIRKFSQRNIEAPSRFSLQSAFMNGWAQYAENLGTEMGLYDDPYSLFGFYYVGRVLLYPIHNITFYFCSTGNMVRAARLVVDTGIHYYGWSKKWAVKYLLDNTALTEESILFFCEIFFHLFYF